MDSIKSLNPGQVAPYGSWSSPISSDIIVAGSTGLDELRIYDDEIYWIERRPSEAGRCVIVRHRNGACADLLPAPFSCRTRVHEYGGGGYCISSTGVFFVNDKDQAIYRLDNETAPSCMTSVPELRFADLVYDETRLRLIAVCEDHTDNSKEPVNTLVAIDATSGAIVTLCYGYDFYSNPSLSHDNNQLAWLCWKHPNMPWDGTELWLGDVKTDGTLTNQTLIEGSGNVSVFQPQWSPRGILHFVSDKTAWWNLYRYHNKKTEQITNRPYEFGLPQWVFGQSTYAFVNDDNIICTYLETGQAHLALVNTNDGAINQITGSWSSFNSIRSTMHDCYFIANSTLISPQIVKLNIHTRQHKNIKTPPDMPFDIQYISHGKNIKFTTRHADSAYAIYYPPANRDFTASTDEKPPLIVITHGGPTAVSSAALDLRKQYWTTRGFALLDVNYSGSTGFGRAYRQRLDGNWGTRDAEDCCDAALFLVNQGLADPERLIIKGSSAGGYTVLCALAFHNIFSAGASYYGISNLESLLRDTHKFESRYLDRLVGPYPEAKKKYEQRSPVFHVEQLDCPVIFFQGIEDKVVPKEQAEKMFDALRKKGIAVAYLAFPEEQHGFRKAETITRCLNAELSFYATVFNIPVRDTAPVEIMNVDKLQNS